MVGEFCHLQVALQVDGPARQATGDTSHWVMTTVAETKSCQNIQVIITSSSVSASSSICTHHCMACALQNIFPILSKGFFQNCMGAIYQPLEIFAGSLALQASLAQGASIMVGAGQDPRNSTLNGCGRTRNNWT